MLIPIDTATGSWRADASAGGETLRLLAVGDFCPKLGTGCGEACSTPQGAAGVLAGVREPLADKDLSVINLECPLDLGGQGIVKDGPLLHAKPEAVAFLTAGGFDVACLANNHMRDFGVAPLRATEGRLDAAGIAHFGTIDHLAAGGRPLVRTVAGRKVALFAFAEHEFNLAERDAPGVEPLAPGPNAVAIAAARARAEADLVVVFVHGGSEFCPFPSPRTVRDLRSFIDAGADAVIAHHAHTPQPMEMYKGRPILYNLGNFLFYDMGEKNTPYWLRSFFARLHFAGRRCIGIDLHPFGVDPATSAMTLRAGPRREAFLARMNRLAEIVADGELHERFWNAYCLTRIAFYRRGMTKANLALDAGEDRRRQAAILRNMFTCQAHHDVIWTALELICTGRDEKPFGVEDELAELMNVEV